MTTANQKYLKTAFDGEPKPKVVRRVARRGVGILDGTRNHHQKNLARAQKPCALHRPFDCRSVS